MSFAVAWTVLTVVMPRWSVPLGFLTTLGRFRDFLGCMRGQRVGFDSKALAMLTGSAWYSSALISLELGYRPLISFEAAPPGIIAWYRETLA